MYALMIDDGGPPHEAASCDGDHRCCRCVWMKYRARSRLDGNTLAWVHLLRELHGGRVLDEEVHVVNLAVALHAGR